MFFSLIARHSTAQGKPSRITPRRAWRLPASTVAWSITCSMATCAILPGNLLAQAAPASQPDTQPATQLSSPHRALEMLDAQSTQNVPQIRQDLKDLQRQLQLSLVRVQIPLARATTRPADGSIFSATAPATQSTTQPTSPDPRTTPVLVLTGLGLIIDEAGHLVVPEYVEPTAGGLPMQISVASAGKWVPATYVASDRPTRLSVFKLNEPFGQPAQLASTPLPPDGALIYVIPSNDPNAHLGFWNTGNAESGWIAGINGQIYGLARQGHLFSLQNIHQISQQLVHAGGVKRAHLGVLITELAPDSPTRKDLPLLGNRPAIIIQEVVPDSSAAIAGLKPGDLIITLDGKPVTDRFSLAAAIAQRDGTTPFGIIRAGQEQTIQVTLKRQ